MPPVIGRMPDRADLAAIGIRAPKANPIIMPPVAMIKICRRYRPKIKPPGAPTLFKVAITGRLPSRNDLVAFATPTPPTTRAVRPTSVRNCEKRSTFRVSAGAAFARERIRQPASGNSERATSSSALIDVCVGFSSRNL